VLLHRSVQFRYRRLLEGLSRLWLNRNSISVERINVLRHRPILSGQARNSAFRRPWIFAPAQEAYACKGLWIAVLLAFLAGFAAPESRAQTSNQNASAPDQQNPETSSAEAQSTLERSRITAYESAMVRDVQFRGAKRRDQSELLNRIPVRSGHRFHRAQLKESLQVLYATGRFKNIQVEAENLPDKRINVYFVVDEAVFIGALHMYGAPRPPTANQLLNSTKLRLGEEFTDEKLRIAIDRIKRVMAENGYFGPDVKTETLAHPENQNLEISFIVTRGVHAHVGEVMVEGDPGYPADQIRKVARLKPGSEVKAAHVTRALNNLRKKYQKQDRLEAQVSLIDRYYQDRSGSQSRHPAGRRPSEKEPD
jgi:outer membrane protein assembly factor BamA